MWTVRLTDAQRDAVAALLRAQPELGPSLEGALEEIDYARWDDLPDARLPWERVAELADAQEIGEADVVWDLCGGLARTLSSAKRQQKPAKARRAPQATG
ncbi:MAG TPA: hypothetical protein VNT32_00715 [Thermoleophilaceae bacterium]|nr:hypothetical protein [Thermoleophilaceae bacterium]